MSDDELKIAVLEVKMEAIEAYMKKDLEWKEKHATRLDALLLTRAKQGGVIIGVTTLVSCVWAVIAFAAGFLKS